MTFFRIAATDVFKCHNIRTECSELCQKLIKSHKQIIVSSACDGRSRHSIILHQILSRDKINLHVISHDNYSCIGI